MEPNEIEAREPDECKGCGISVKKGCTLHNTPSNCVEHISFPYMEIGESMHMECYIEHVIETILKKKIGLYE